MASLKKTVSGLLTPILYLNLAGLAVGAVWLGVMAQWQVVWVGVMALLFAPYIIPILIIPAGILSHFMSLYRAAQRPDKERLMFTLSLAYILLFLTLWCVSIFEYVTHSVVPQAVHAALLWADSAALVPLLLWTNRDRGNIFIMTMVEVAQLAIVVLSAVRLLDGATSFWPSFSIFGGIMALAAITQAVYEKKFIDKSGELPR